MSARTVLKEKLRSYFAQEILALHEANAELTIEVPAEHILKVAQALRDQDDFKFEILIDLCGVDYLHYGCDEWRTTQATVEGFERGVTPLRDLNDNPDWRKPRFAVVYHLLSITHNHRLRVKAFVPDEAPFIDSVVPLWNSANWYEREAFDLYGLLFKGHDDLRRLLTDYGFIGHPFRKDYPMEGKMAVRYDAKKKRVIYEPVDIVPRTLVPKVIRKAEEEVKGNG